MKMEQTGCSETSACKIQTPGNYPKESIKRPHYLPFIIIIIIIFLHGLDRLICSGIDALPSFPGASTISSSSMFVVHGVFRKSGVVHSLEMVDPLLFVFVSHVLYCRDLQSFSYDFATYFV